MKSNSLSERKSAGGRNRFGGQDAGDLGRASKESSSTIKTDKSLKDLDILKEEEEKVESKPKMPLFAFKSKADKGNPDASSKQA